MYGKHFAQMYTGSMVGSGPVVFATWGYVIAHVTTAGEVELNTRIIGPILGCEPEEVKRAIQFLCEPDPSSRTPEEDGKRLIQIGPFLYKVVTHSKYRALRDEDERRAYHRDYMRRYRQKRKEARKDCEVSVKSVKSGEPQLTHIDVDVEVESPSLSLSRGREDEDFAPAEPLRTMVMGLGPNWSGEMDGSELEGFRENLEIFKSWTEAEFALVREWLESRPDKPPSRCTFLRAPNRARDRANEWQTDQKNPKLSKNGNNQRSDFGGTRQNPVKPLSDAFRRRQEERRIQLRDERLAREARKQEAG